MYETNWRKLQYDTVLFIGNDKGNGCYLVQVVIKCWVYWKFIKASFRNVFTVSWLRPNTISVKVLQVFQYSSRIFFRKEIRQYLSNLDLFRKPLNFKAFTEFNLTR